MTYATVTDLEARWRPLTDQEDVRADALLDDATATIDLTARSVGTKLDENDETIMDAAKSVCCQMVIRAMLASVSADSVAAPVGASQASWTAGPFAQSATFANPNGDIYLTNAEIAKLGLTGAGVYTMPVAIHNSSGEVIN